MQELLNLDLINNKKEVLSLDKSLNLYKDISNNIGDFKGVIENVLQSGIEYTAKGLNLGQKLKGTLKEIKDSLKSSDFKEIVQTAIEGSVKTGLEVSKNKTSSLKSINSLKNNALSGGLNFLLSAGVDILINKVFKGNLLLPHIKTLMNGLKSFLKSNAFIQKIESGINKLFNKKDKIKNSCDDWYKAYDVFNLKEINAISKKLSGYKNVVKSDNQLTQEINTIENMTTLINNKKDKLSQIQLQICKDL